MHQAVIMLIVNLFELHSFRVQIIALNDYWIIPFRQERLLLRKSQSLTSLKSQQVRQLRLRNIVVSAQDSPPATFICFGMIVDHLLSVIWGHLGLSRRVCGALNNQIAPCLEGTDTTRR